MARTDLVKGALFVQASAETGFLRMWREKYAVLTTTHFAYYESGAQFNRHRERPVFTISTSSLEEIQNMPQMVRAKHAMKVSWNTEGNDVEELLLGFDDERVRMKWSEQLHAQIPSWQGDIYENLQVFVSGNGLDVSLNSEESGKTSVIERGQSAPREAMTNSETYESPEEELYDDVAISQSPVGNPPINRQGALLRPPIACKPSPAPRQRQVFSPTPLATDGKKSTKALDNPLYSSRQSQMENEDTVCGQYEGKSDKEHVRNARKLKRRMIVYAIDSHQAEDDDEISFLVGDMIEVLEDPGLDDGWCKGRLVSSLDEGFFPVNNVDTTDPAELSGKRAESDIYCTMSPGYDEDEDIYECQEEPEHVRLELRKEDEELRKNIKDTQCSLRKHIEALKKVTEERLYDVPPNSKDVPNADSLLRLDERSVLTKRLERTDKRLQFVISERDSYQTKLKLSEDKAELIQRSLEEALQNNLDLNMKLSQLEQHKTRLDLRTMERDEARSLLAEAERLNEKLCNDIISLSAEMWRVKEAKHRARRESVKAITAAKSAANEEKEARETAVRELTVTKKSYSERLSTAEAKSRQLKERISDMDRQLKTQKAKLDDALKQLAEAQKELAGNSDNERNLGRQVGCLREELDAMEAKYTTVLEGKRIAEKQALDAKEEVRLLRENQATAEVPDDEARLTIEGLRKRIKDLEELNRCLEELQDLAKNTNKM